VRSAFVQAQRSTFPVELKICEAALAGIN